MYKSSSYSWFDLLIHVHIVMFFFINVYPSSFVPKQIALVETESELSQVSRKVEELQKKLSLLTASKEQLVEKCNEARQLLESVVRSI